MAEDFSPGLLTDNCDGPRQTSLVWVFGVCVGGSFCTGGSPENRRVCGCGYVSEIACRLTHLGLTLWLLLWPLSKVGYIYLCFFHFTFSMFHFSLFTLLFGFLFVFMSFSCDRDNVKQI